MKQLPRMTDWLLFALVLSLLIFALSPQQLPVSLYKLNLIAIAGVVGYWLDRSLFPYARPDVFLEQDAEPDIQAAMDASGGVLECQIGGYWQRDLLLAAAMLRRALIVAAAMIAVGLGA